MRRERVVDVAVVLLAALLGMASVTQIPTFPEPYDAVAFGLMLAGAVALWFRRRAPVAVAWFVAALAAVLALAVWVWPGVVSGTMPAADSTLLPAAAPFAAYSVAAHRSRSYRLAWLPLFLTATIACLGAPPSARVLAVVGLVVTLVGGPAVLGRYIAARAEHTEREQRVRAEQARREERLRLAAEIHDVVSHRVSVMVLQAGALHLTAADEPTRQAASELRTVGCQALDELRDLVGLLSTTGPVDPAGAAPLEPLPDLSELVEDSASVGMAVEVVETGDPCLLSPAVGRTAYRAVQEALTNARKHSPGARVRVEVRYLPTGVRVSIHNTAPTRPADARLTDAGSGAGLLGLRRQVELVNGMLHAQPCADGGFEVAATLPSTIQAGERR
jgi:signal transduction histidine kinase